MPKIGNLILTIFNCNVKNYLHLIQEIVLFTFISKVNLMAFLSYFVILGFVITSPNVNTRMIVNYLDHTNIDIKSLYRITCNPIKRIINSI